MSLDITIVDWKANTYKIQWIDLRICLMNIVHIIKQRKPRKTKYNNPSLRLIFKMLLHAN